MNFMKTFWAALLAFIVANILFWIVLVMILSGIASFMSEPAPEVKSNSVLFIDLKDGIKDSPNSSVIGSVGFSGLTFDNSNTVFEAVTAIERATYDDNIKGIYISLNSPSISLANMEELRNALVDFKESGKFIVSYNDSYSQLGYYFSSVADRVFLNPQGNIYWTGLSSHSMFFKGLIDKLGVNVEILRHGTFKAAVEPFMLDRMSQENRLQTSTMLNTMWGSLLHDISLSRGIDSAVLSNYATELSIRSAEYAVEYGMADAMLYEDQVKNILRHAVRDGVPVDEAYYIVANKLDNNAADDDKTAGGDKKVTKKDVNMVSFPDYIAAGKNMVNRTSKNKIAVVYADGDIVDGNSDRNSVGGASLSAKLARVRKDDNVKAVVLRVNSPGGSALASEVIWREMELIREGKPLIVSMGGLAASGGYYISCPADVILANRTTITGSIGVFGLLADISRPLRDKLGITVDVVNTNPSSDLGSSFRGVTRYERDILMQGVEQVYTTFVNHVADGRNMTFDAVDEIGGGRVWSGVSAMDIGLIDGYGGLKDAVLLAVDRAGIVDDFRVWHVTDEPESLTAILRQLSNIKEMKMKDELGEAFMYYKTLKNMVSDQGVQARMPYTLDIN